MIEHKLHFALIVDNYLLNYLDCQVN